MDDLNVLKWKQKTLLDLGECITIELKKDINKKFSITGNDSLKILSAGEM